MRKESPFRKFCALVMLLTLLAGSVSATLAAPVQEVTGSIQGTVKDPNGAVVSGAVVTATSAQRSYKATTNDDGQYNLPALLPGVYSVTATGSGFGTTRRDDVTVELGRTLQVNFDLQVSTKGETVTVTASDEPLVDVTSTKVATNITQKEIDVLPKGLNMQSLLRTAPGTRPEPKSGGFQIDGASGSENVFIIDGVEVTDVNVGTLAASKDIPTSFLREVQVKSAGYEAEFGGATGGVINSVTRSGSNDWHGEIGVDYSNDKMRASDNPALRLNLIKDTLAEYFDNPSGKDKNTNVNPTFAIGGPIIKDKFWFFSSYSPQFFNTTRRLDLISTAAGGTQEQTLSSRYIDYQTKNDFFLTRLDASPTNKLAVSATFINSPTKQSGPPALLAFQTSSLTSFSNTRYDQQGGYNPAWQFSGAATYNLTDKLILSFRGGHNYDNQKGGSYDIPVGQPLVTIVRACVAPLAGCAAGTTTVGNPSITNNFLTLYDQLRRTNLNFDATYVKQLFGQQHLIKGGYQANLLRNRVNQGNAGGAINFYFDSSFDAGLGAGAERGAYGYYRVTDFGTVGEASSRNQGFFIQDSWSAHRRLTLNLGLRVENEYIPSFPINADFHPSISPEALANTPQKPINFGWGDKLAPRLGGAWDVFGDGKLKLYGSYSVFFDTMKYQLARGSFGADHFLRGWYRLEQADYRGITLDNRPGQQIGVTIDFRVPSNVTEAGAQPQVDPNLKPVREHEYTVGADYALTGDMMFSARLTRKALDRTIEDVGAADAFGNEVYTIGNPGFGTTVDYFTALGFPATPKARREYTGLELRLAKRFTHNWSADVSYIHSKLYGNYSGLASSDENGRTSPNVNRFFDLPELIYDTYGREILGRLATDRPNTFKGFVNYNLNWKGMQTDFSTFMQFYQGIPLSTNLTEHVGPAGAVVFPEGRGDLGRTPWFTQTDLLINHRIKLNERATLKLSLNVANLFDERTTTNIFNAYLKGDQNVQYVDITDYLTSNGDWRQRVTSQGKLLDPRFGMANAFQAPRLARFNIGVQF